ncbi:MAG: PAS domain S-box protein [Deltaproteobacteria bacterium]|nr:PAS domain S-box protein [Deltaproteobacteria bacterium]
MPATFVAEEALRERERYFRSLLFAIHEDILVITRDYRITDVNNTFLVTTGFKREEAIGRHCYKVSHGYNEPCDRQGEECMLQTVFETGKPHKCGHFHMRTDGSKVWVDILLSPLRDEKGNVTHVIEAIRDVTDLHQAQEALKESEKRFRLLYENAPLSYQSLDEDGHIVEVNKAWIDFLGYSKNEVIGQWLGEFLALDYQEYFRNNFYRFKSAGEIHGMKFEMLRKDGAHIIVSIDGSIGHDEQGCFKAHCIMHDITEREQLERQLRQAQKMEAIGTLAGGIAHDFNNILGAVIGCTEMSLFDVPEGTPVHRHLLEVLNAGNRAKDLVNQILAFSRQTEQERKPVKISLIIKETLKLLRASLPTTIKIRQYIETDSDMVLADPTQIHQVLMNLCTNAAHAMREKGGVLQIRLADVELDPEDAARHPDMNPGPYLRLTVSDTGHGINRAVIERIFDPYFTTKGPGEGTGLGLAVVHGIVKSHGGAITVHSEPGEGTAFQVFLPGIESRVTPEIEAYAPLPTGNECVLFVDDEKVLVRIAKEMLERLGYEVIPRTSSIEALESFRERPDHFDLVITDQTMPNMTGTELAKELMRIRPDIPIILCTGFSEVITPEKAMAMGIREFIMKPLMTRDLAESVRRVLDG